MSSIRYTVKTTSRFRKDFKLARRRGLDAGLFKQVVSILSEGGTLPDRYHDHALTGNMTGFRECHITPDLLLVYLIEKDVLVLTLTRTGTHSDLFGK
ncbi:type II toxin-antitoxin system YafQ family toxin [Bifidobacterium longum subsp. infantis]|uniref:Type II toxin-antitoxin system YafQ family toxin n=1 Tax=Bifidobacterium longum subsp. infantis TaxID=1682 RepID=A0AAX1LLC1_BIFLI|nr:type II toxin-antitoxin system YafQ family toxin [Bifidobacterium longum]QSP98030.1 type II toxin-antitoxin system YafQ family toxin [Bifidobacterium longum subsp. infantis]QSZ18277.1 type II toxin-antitoxin system YafQ family toxin [Bifidobacterium longum subsp. infantis]QTB92270.1 type II toxin-antitoxin system YafQ family toxin [Bifidobacterium longum subsp. infantis]GDY89574.1 addiction module toxin, RelE/StbE family [Bifidobacteriaceae bacterium MCC01971]